MSLFLLIVLLTALILVHELGHFWSARRAGIRVEEFGLGLPPRIIGIQRDAATGRFRLVPGFWSKKKPGATTIYSFNLLPIGGFVRIFGEDGADSRDPRSFANQTWWVRARTLLAGVTMNLVLAVCLLVVGFQIGLPVDIGNEQIAGADTKIRIAAVAPHSPAADAGIKIGDSIARLRARGVIKEVKSIEEVQSFIREHAGTELEIALERGGSERTAVLTPRINPPPGEGALGIAMNVTGLKTLPLLTAIRESAVIVVQLAGFLLATLGSMLARLFAAGELPSEVVGPVGIAVLAGDVSQLGLPYVLWLAVQLSVSLAVLNSLPFPALDGGRFLFLLIEKLKGSPVSRRVEQIVHSVGMALLLLAIFAISVQDIRRFF
ncbi:site-2 protease family protein [Candidatus Parcubacteria bacterium]|nr:site-2 protease family protein [Candidatus Parcubacteria bacterium]